MTNILKYFKMKRLIKKLMNRQELTGKFVMAHEKRKAILELGKIGDLRAVKSLIEALLGRVECLGVADPRDRNLLTNKSYAYELRGCAALVLGEMADKRPVKPLTQALLMDIHEWVRYRAAIALGKLQDPIAMQALTLALCDCDHDTRKAAAEALSKLGEKKWEEMVLGDDSDFERLGQSMDKRAIESLIHALENNSVHSRKMAASSLICLARDDFNQISNEWLSIAEKVKAPHHDHSDGVNSWSCEFHSDDIKHTDTGIGLEIPPELKTN